MSLSEEQKNAYRQELGRMEAQTMRDARRRLSTADFDSLAIIGRGAFGEVGTNSCCPPRRASVHGSYK